jgi:hypothetical protein
MTDQHGPRWRIAASWSVCLLPVVVVLVLLVLGVLG